MRATQAGTFRAQGLDIFYRERWFGVDVRRREHVGPLVYGCARRTRARVPHCALPDPFG
jgi:hypothetical protein